MRLKEAILSKTDPLLQAFLVYMGRISREALGGLKMSRRRNM